MNVEWIAGVPTSNFKTGREGNPIGLIIDHWMGTSNLRPGALFASAVSRFQSDRSIVSAHFLISADGRIGQMVSTDDTAYHSGDWDTNLRSIGIEHEASPTLPPSDALYAASAELHHELARIYDLPLEVGLTVKGHRNIVPTACPGTLDLDHIVALAGLEEGDLAFANDPDAQAFKNDINDSVDAIKEDLKALHAAIAALGNATPATALPATTLAEIAATTAPPPGYHWVGIKLVAN